MVKAKKKKVAALATSGVALTVASETLAELTRPIPPKWSQVALAKELGVKPAVVWTWVSGHRLPKPAIMAKLEELLGIPMKAWTQALPAKGPPT